MNIAKYRPFWTQSPRSLFESLFSDAIENLLDDSETRREGRFVPAVDIKETEDEYTITAELPGIKKEDVHIELKNGLLTISGERKFEHEEKKENYTRIERSYGAFRRTFNVPEHVKEDKIEAIYKDGLLTVKLPKGEAVKPKEIEVKVQ